MSAFKQLGLGLAIAGALIEIAAAVTVRIDNPTGSVVARVRRGNEVQIRHASPNRRVRPEDTRVNRLQGGELIVVRCESADRAPIRLEVDLPYGVELEITTREAAVALNGLIYRAKIRTDSGDVLLRLPLAATRLSIDAEQAPREYVAPEGAKLASSKANEQRGEQRWQLRDQLPLRHITYGSVHVEGKAPGKIEVFDAPIPKDSPVKLPWQAPAVLEELLADSGRAGSSGAAAPASRTGDDTASGRASPEVRFTSDVRMVNLMVAVGEKDGGPVADLRREEFDVRENGVSQEISFLGSEEVPFNLVLLLDWSSSTERDRGAMKEAARGFIRVARPQDRIAVYALVGNVFLVASPLTEDRQELLEKIKRIPESPGGSPLYDAIMLALAEELRSRRGERNALLILSDGVDNQISRQSAVTSRAGGPFLTAGLPSQVSFQDLSRVVSEMDVLVYPILLDPMDGSDRLRPQWSSLARGRLHELARGSGGRMFRARSIRDLDPVYPKAAAELRSVYNLAYYPKDQKFDGSWRKIEVKVRRREAVVRTRSGYSAR